jgi:hypothetical protein
MNPVRATSLTPKGGRPRNSGDPARPRRRGDRMSKAPSVKAGAAL